MEAGSQTRDRGPTPSLELLPRVLTACRELPGVANAIFLLASVVLESQPASDLGAAVAEAFNCILWTFSKVAPSNIGSLELVRKEESSPGFAGESVLSAEYGFVPRLFQAQRAWPSVVDAEAKLFSELIFNEERLSRVDKERMMLVIAVAKRDVYSCALHHQMLTLLGESASAKRIVTGELSVTDSLEQMACVTAQRIERGEVPRMSQEMRDAGFTSAQCVEALGVCALAQFVHILQARLQPAPDFPVPKVFLEKLYPPATEIRPTGKGPTCEDPDGEVVAQVRAGETEAFAVLIRRHTKRVFATLFGLLQDAEEARDVSQEVFLKAFENLDGFEGRSKFSSWLMSIAINSGTEVLRKRKHFESIEAEDGEDDWRPTQLQEWSENPEQCFAREEMIDLVRRGVMRLPNKYRLALLLRDVSQMPTEDAAEALGLSVPALKARVLRGRLMLRETLAPHFTHGQRGAHG